MLLHSKLVEISLREVSHIKEEHICSVYAGYSPAQQVFNISSDPSEQFRILLQSYLCGIYLPEVLH